MKIKILFAFATFALAAVTAFGQDADRLVKDAGKALSAYHLDPNGNADKLAEAVDAIDEAYAMTDLTGDYKSNITRAQVFTEVVANDYKKILIQPKMEPKSAEAGTKAIKSIEDALNTAEKKYHTKEALKVLSELAPYLSVIGNQFIGLQQYDKAYAPLSNVLVANDLLKNNGEDSIFENDADLQNHKYVTAVCALRAGKMEEGEKILMELYNAGSKEVGVYTNLYNLKIDSDEEGAMKILEKGKEIDPGNTELLFAEINYYIKKEQFDVLEEKLKLAIEKDPENPSVYSALGNVYMNLSDQSMKEGNDEDAQKYFDSAMSYFEQTLELDPKSFDAYYSIGSLYFNQAAEKTKEMQELGLSKEEQTLYAELETETEELFEKALPYFKKAEQINPSDMNTLIALKEIYARQDDFETSNEFKTRLETVQGGGKIDESYFQK